MAECIEREAAIAYAPLPKHLREYQTMNLDDAWEDGYDFAIRQIESIPAADVRPVVWGKWIGYPECLKYPNAYSDDHIVCSACEECFSILDNDCERFNFCPNCGAMMEES